MNKIYRIIWNSTLGQWIVTSELGRGKTKSSASNSLNGLELTSSMVVGDIIPCGVKQKLQKLVVASTLALLAAPADATDITATSYTPGNANNGAKSIAVGSDTVNLNGAMSWTGATATNGTYYTLIGGYNAGYITGGIDPNGKVGISLGSQNNGVAVYDPVTQKYTTVNTYNNIIEMPGGSLNSFAAIYSPTPAGTGPFIASQVANIANGGTLNINVTGTVGNASVKDTVYVDVTQGTANWNSNNTVLFGKSDASVTEANLQPYTRPATFSSYNGTFSVTDAKGAVTQHSVTDFASFQTYNNWLVSQLTAGNFGSSSDAQTNYNNAIAQAYSNTTYTYNINPQSSPIDIATDPLMVPAGTRIAMRVDGADSYGNIAAGAGMSFGSGGDMRATLLQAQNGGTITNNGTVANWNLNTGVVVATGGKFVNNGVRSLAFSSNGTGVNLNPDSITGAGSSYVNNGTVNLAAYSAAGGTGATNSWVSASSGGAVINHGVVNVGTMAQIGLGQPVGATLGAGGSFVNDTDGLIYLGREASTITSGDPMSRGGADVAQVNGATAIYANAGAIADNKGTIIIGDLVQNGLGIWANGAGATTNLVNSGTIEVRGHYNASPIQNIGIYSTNSAVGGVANNSGTINLTGINVVGIKTLNGGRAQSLGTINVIGGADPASGLSNYGIWSEGSGSQVNLSGTVNLAGDGAIGAHARSAGSVAVSGLGNVVFSGGTNQIGYFAYGSGATINNTGTGTQDVSTEGSTLFRMEDGADFTGSVGASSTLTASGKDSTAVVVTGRTGTDVSAFNSGGMTINTSGENAAAVRVEGGAQGKIASTATINLTGTGSVAGIVDGQKHSLDGTAMGTPIAGALSNGTLAAGAAGFGTGTVLVAQANLNSALDEVTGFIAKNSASFSNSGNIIFTGKNTTGIQVLEGSTGGNSGSITIQDGSVGLDASTSGAATTLNNTGSLVLKGGTNADRTTGISAAGSAVTVNMSAGNIDMQGQGAVGVRATTGANVNLTGTSAVTFASEETGVTDQIAFQVSGAGSTINTNTSGTGLVASGKNSTLIRLEHGATQSGVLSMGATGTGSRGIWATGADTTVTALSGSTFDVGGKDAMAVLVQGGADVDLKAGTIVNLTGSNTTVGTVDGNEYAIDGVTVLNTNTGSNLISEATLNSTTAGATGFITQNLGILTNTGLINFQGAASQAIKVLNGIFVNTANISANGTAVYVEGAQSTVENNGGAILATDGKAAVELGAGANLNLTGSGINTVEGQGTAHAVLVDSGAAGLTVTGAHLLVNAAGASGNGIENAGNITGIQLNNTTIDVMDGKGVRTSASLNAMNSGQINVAGSGTGLAFEDLAGAAIGNNIDLSGSSALNINVAGANGNGISVKHTGNGDLNNAANVTVAAGGGSAVALSGVSTFENAGKLNTASTATVADLGATQTVTNSGEITAASATGSAMTFDSQDSTLSNTGKIVGVVDLGAGANTATNAAGASITGNIISATGNNTVTNSGTIAGDIALGSGTNNVTLNAGSTVANVSGTTGVNNVTVKGDAAFTALDGGIGGGADTLTFDGTTHTLSATNDIDHFENMMLINGSTISTADLIKMTDTAGGAGAIDIDGTSTLSIAAPVAYSLNHALSGTGKINVTSGSQFDFGSNSGNQFAGRVNMNSDTFALSGFNTSALTNAILSVMGNNTTTVGSGIQRIGGLVFNDGTVNFGTAIPNAAVSDNFIQIAGTLDTTGTGKVQINKAGYDNADAPVVNKTLGLLDQQDETLVQLASASAVTGGAGAMQLIDQNGAAISNGSINAIDQNGVRAADATYDYRLVTSGDEGNGLYVGYGLTQLDLLSNGGDKLVITTAGNTEKTLSAKVIGNGDLGIAAGNGADALTISNVTNSYTGETDLQTGTLILGTDNALGQTSKLILANSTTANVNGKTQSVGELNGQSGSVLDIHGGNLTLAQGGISSGSLTGKGELTVAGGVLTVNNTNAGLTATTRVNAMAEALLKDVQALGTGSVIANGDVTLDNASGTFANELFGNGKLNANTGSQATLSGDNSGFSGSMNIDSTSTLTVSESKHVGGTTAINNANQLIVNNSAAMTLNTPVNGTGDLTKTNTGTLTLSGINTYSGSTQIQGGVVAVSADANLGDGSATNLTVLDGGDLQITADLTSARDVTLAQRGSVIVDSGVAATMNGWDDGGNSASTLTKAGQGTLIWSGDNSANTADVSVSGGKLQVESLTNLASSSGKVNLASAGTLSILKNSASATDVDFTRQLTGSGELNVNLGDKAHDFTFDSSAAGGSFAGQVTMDNGRFILNDDAASVMSNATLTLNWTADRLGSSKLDGNHAIGGLTMHGGQVEVDYSTTDHRPLGHLTVNTLNVTGGTLAVTTPANLPNPIPVTGESLFDQDDGVFDQIVGATAVQGVDTQIAVTKVDGTPVAPDTLVGLMQNGTQAGNAHYNYYGAVKNDGLYLGYGLTELDAFAGQSVVLDNSHATDKTLSAKLTGEGGFTLNITDTAYVGNLNSDYTGATDLNSGHLILNTDNALGQTAALNAQAGTQLDLNGHSQTVGQLNTVQTSLMNLDGGDLTVTGGGQVDGVLAGNGQLSLTGDTLTVTSNNGTFTGTTDIATGATARQTQAQGLGQGVINNEGTLNLDGAAGTLLNSLHGTGDVLLTRNADMYLGGDNSDYAGSFTTTDSTMLTATESNQLGTSVIHNDGTLVLDTADLWAMVNTVNGSGALVKRGMGTVQLDGNNVTAGLTNIENGLLLVGGAPGTASQALLTSDVNITQSGALGGYGAVNGNVTNGGNLIMGRALTNGTPGVFTINGNYAGNNGTVVFNTDLEGDSAATDKLVINGNTSGQSDVRVMSVRGDGAQTQNGIKLIDVNGQSDGQFTLQGRAVAGAYEYFLNKGGVATPDDGGWYLRSQLPTPTPTPDPTPAPIVRPEAGAYTANIAAANTMFVTTLHDRLGETNYVDMLTGEEKVTSMWLRNTGGHTAFRDNSGQLKTQSNRYVLQMGGDLAQWGEEGGNRTHLGMMAGYGNSQSNTRSSVTQYSADGSVNGYSAGLYGTWLADEAEHTGAYVDTWAQYNWFNNSVKGDELASESYKSKGFTASVETGYAVKVGEFKGSKGTTNLWYIQPQAQAIWMGVKANDHTEANGTRVASQGDGNLMTRLGVRTYLNSHNKIDDGKDREFQPFVEANWIHNTNNFGATMNGATSSMDGAKNIAEIKMGVEGQLNKNLNLWGNVGTQVGDKGYNDAALTVGFKYQF